MILYIDIILHITLRRTYYDSIMIMFLLYFYCLKIKNYFIMEKV